MNTHKPRLKSRKRLNRAGATSLQISDLSHPDERQLRVQLAIRLNDLLKAEGLTQAAAAKLLGIAQPQVSELKNYKLSRFSSELLLHYITLLNRDWSWVSDGLGCVLRPVGARNLLFFNSC